jgi:hypothetical protein
MPSASKTVNVSSGGQLEIVVDQVSQLPGSNMSLVRVRGIMRNTSSDTSYHLDKNIGAYISGSWSYSPDDFSFDLAGGESLTFVDHQNNLNHNSAGELTVSFAVGYGATGTATFGDYKQAAVSLALTRIPKAPSKPGQPHVTNLLPTTCTVSWTAATSNGGSGITSYLLRRWTGSAGHGSYVDNSANNLSRNVTGLTPGTSYGFAVYARNGATYDNNGYSGVSVGTNIQTLAGAYIRSGGAWKLAVPYVRTGGVWKVAVPYVRKSGTWKLTE